MLDKYYEISSHCAKFSGYFNACKRLADNSSGQNHEQVLSNAHDMYTLKESRNKKNRTGEMVLPKKYFHKYIPAWNILRFSQKWQAFCDQREGTSSRTTNEKKRSADEIPEGEETQQGSSQTPIGRDKARKLGKLQSTPPSSAIDLSF